MERREADFFRRSTGSLLRHATLEADDLLGGLAQAETDAGGQALLFTGDRDMFQCVSEDVTVLWPAGKGETEPIGPAEVRKRYGIRPDQVPYFIALRGDPSDGLPGAKGIGEKTARELLNEHDTLDALLALPISLGKLAGAPEPHRAGRRAARLPPDRHAPADRALNARPTRRRTSRAPRRRRVNRSMNRLAERLGRVGERLRGNPWFEPHGRRLPMFGRFEDERSSPQETDGGAVAVEERERPRPPRDQRGAPSATA